MPKKALPRIHVGQPGEAPNAIWAPQSGLQEEILLRTEDEILLGGEKGGGKSFGAIGWMIKGNPVAEHVHPADISYINHSQYRGIVLRRNREDLLDWFEKAKVVYEALGAEATKQPWEFTWPTGAKIFLGHLADDESYQKYTGQMFQRAFIDEVTHIPEEHIYQQIRSCCRSAHKELRPQILLACNPEGRGLRWVYRRFVAPGGKELKPGTIIREWWFNRHLQKKVCSTRVYLRCSLHENKIMLDADPMYENRLASNPIESLRRAYLYGDWGAFRGAYFSSVFRPDGPRPNSNEPENARHVVPASSVRIMPWWPRILAMDWGYSHHSVVLKAAVSPSGQLHVYDELAAPGITAEEWGSKIAEWCLAELRGMMTPQITLWLSPETFDTRGDPKTRAEQIQAGINKVLGPESCVLLPHSEDQDIVEMAEFQRTARIVVRRAYNQRVSGWEYLRSLMLWSDPVAPASAPDPAYINKLVMEHGNVEQAFRYARACEERAPRALPRILIHDTCPRLPQAILSANYDERPTGNPEDVLKTTTWEDDFLDAVRYLAMGFKVVANQVPKDAWVEDRMAHWQRLSPNLSEDALFQIRNKAIEDWENQTPQNAPFSIRRGHGIYMPEQYVSEYVN